MRTKGSVYNMHADFQGEILEKKSQCILYKGK